MVIIGSLERRRTLVAARSLLCTIGALQSKLIRLHFAKSGWDGWRKVANTKLELAKQKGRLEHIAKLRLRKAMLDAGRMEVANDIRDINHKIGEALASACPTCGNLTK